MDRQKAAPFGTRSLCRPDKQGWRFIVVLSNTIEFKYRIPHTLWNLNRMINRILVATDASAASNRALKMAAQLAEQYNAEILIVHVIRDMQIPYEIKEIPELESGKFESFNNAREEVMRKIAETVLRAAKEKTEKAGANKVETVIGTGDPATSILSLAKRRKMDMIVIGTRGLGKLKGTILGSVSRKVTNNAETSCLIVR